MTIDFVKRYDRKICWYHFANRGIELLVYLRLDLSNRYGVMVYVN